MINERVDRNPFRWSLRCSVINNATETTTASNKRVLIDGPDVNKSFMPVTLFYYRTNMGLYFALGVF
jgi:hypothetical protein